tara:strand:+ start:642 stop:1316 length:675 start_codon:yes stop_codon:yes gene_type:complete
MPDNKRTVTHILYTVNNDAVNPESVVYKKGGNIFYLCLSAEEAANTTLPIKKYIKNASTHCILRTDFDDQLDLVKKSVEETLPGAEVMIDMKRKNWYHIKFEDAEKSVGVVGKSVQIDEYYYKIDKWKPKAKYAEVVSYMKYLLFDNFQNDTYLQNLAKDFSNWIPLKRRVSDQLVGICTFKWCVNRRVNIKDIKDAVLELGGCVSQDGWYVSTPDILDKKLNV